MLGLGDRDRVWRPEGRRELALGTIWLDVILVSIGVEKRPAMPLELQRQQRQSHRIGLDEG